MSDMHQVNFSRTVSNKRCGLRGMVISVLRFFGSSVFSFSTSRRSAFFLIIPAGLVRT